MDTLLRYDPLTHTTAHADGHDVPHVTTVLGATGVATDFEALADSGLVRSGDLEYRRQLGSAFHADSHAYDDGDLDWRSVHPDVVPFLEAWVACREALGLVPVVRERQVYHPEYDYTGIMDGIFALPEQVGRGRSARAKHVLLDLKLGDPEDSGARYQTAAYTAAHLRLRPGVPVDARQAVRIVPRCRVPYRVSPYDPDWTGDFGRFCAFLTTYRCQKARARR